MTTSPKTASSEAGIVPPSTVKEFSFAPYGSSEAAVHPSVVSKLKRCIDLIGAVLGLTLTALIFILIAIAIYIDNPGPILYSQVRCGHRGRRFRIWKFRSMVVNADQIKHTIKNQAKGHIFKNHSDPRVTRVGRWLRRTSLDELPQFWNVWLGDMSLVGTRPPTPDEVENYTSYHWQRLEVKPGITGEWQVNGRSKVSDFDQIVAMDVQYIKKWSNFYDFQLVLRTIQVVLDREGAW
jgi:lipopolysaccharide/colanic/teichoic acid biosynthesis glycosyltransferase